MKTRLMTPANTTEKQDWGTEMIRFFRKRRPQHRAEPVVSLQDARVAKFHRITPAHFATLPAIVQVDLREQYFHAQGLAS